MMGDLTKNFSRHEFICPCCKKFSMDMGFIELLQKARDIAKIPFKITSGYRCPKHNKAVGGEPDSSHLSGFACDIDLDGDNGYQRLRIVKALLNVGIMRIVLYKSKTIIHADIHYPKKSEGIFLKWL